MSDNGKVRNEDRIVVEVISNQLEHFQKINPPCRGLELPDGILLRHTQSASLYFYLRTGVDNGKIKATWFVVPGSGTGDLSGLRGEGGFQGEFGKGSDGTLDYWFE